MAAYYTEEALKIAIKDKNDFLIADRGIGLLQYWIFKNISKTIDIFTTVIESSKKIKIVNISQQVTKFWVRIF